MESPGFVVEEVTDPAEVARCRARSERARRNSAWLQAHWAELLPQARGKFVAVAGEEAFVADTHEEAWAQARAAHPDEDGAISQYVFPKGAVRISDRGGAVVRRRRREWMTGAGLSAGPPSG
jgi:hypothetical protein